MRGTELGEHWSYYENRSAAANIGAMVPLNQNTTATAGSERLLSPLKAVIVRG